MAQGRDLLGSMLDPVDRASESIFGVLMAVSIVGALGVTAGDSQEIRTTLVMALACNIAWGFTDAVMYLVTTAITKSRNFRLARRLLQSTDQGEAHRIITEALPDLVASCAKDETVEALRRDLGGLRLPRTTLAPRDFLAALGVFVVVVAATFPVVLPFLFVSEVTVAKRVSNALAVAVLYAQGYVVGRYAGATPWAYGVAFAGLGAVLVAVIMALGG
jgi:VIT1/CCC1 family predicted Fe2+/Mn2+ transporter